MENHHFQWVNQLEICIFNSFLMLFVCLPEASGLFDFHQGWGALVEFLALLGETEEFPRLSYTLW